MANSTRWFSILAGLALCAGGVTIAAHAHAQPAKPVKGVTLRGCLTGWTLTHLDPADATLKVPDNLRVRSLKVIRSQVTALDRHQVEVIGSLEGIPGQDRGVLVSDSDKAKLYIGGGDPNLGADLGIGRSEPSTIYVRTIKDIADTCQ
jgi:hypothetical protein